MPFASFRPLILTFVVAFSAVLAAQGSYEAQVRGVVTDQSNAVVVNAAITITNDATNIAQTAHSDERGKYLSSRD